MSNNIFSCQFEELDTLEVLHDGLYVEFTMRDRFVELDQGEPIRIYLRKEKVEDLILLLQNIVGHLE